MHQLQSIFNSDLTEGQEGCPITHFGHFSPCAARSAHFCAEVHNQLSTNVCSKHAWPSSNCLFCVHQLQSIFNYDVTEWAERCCLPCLGLFSSLWNQIYPILNWSLWQLVNQNLHQMHMTNVKLAFPQVATAIWCQLWHDGGSWKGITSFVLAIFAHFFNQLQSPATFQPKSAPTKHCGLFLECSELSIWHCWHVCTTQTLTSNRAVWSAWAQQQQLQLQHHRPWHPESTSFCWVCQLPDCLEKTCHWGHVSLQRSVWVENMALNKLFCQQKSERSANLSVKVCQWKACKNSFEFWKRDVKS